MWIIHSYSYISLNHDSLSNTTLTNVIKDILFLSNQAGFLGQPVMVEL